MPTTSFERDSEKAGHHKTPQANYYYQELIIWLTLAITIMSQIQHIAGQEARLLPQQDAVGSMLFSLLWLP